MLLMHVDDLICANIGVFGTDFNETFPYINWAELRIIKQFIFNEQFVFKKGSW